ncbi:ABC1 kinase family protein [Parachitinimonas caeni]|uniref:AarF/UbiB family protein n=1 Tax=Parachitinimonas caeni TaxID=3031301 RepID=A0ABT7E2M0_9NEIS|nr:AarF/UbiB family protein [Parachitinimonas caeni]MDK2125157.1 AarF/UbiB family protein [Parachitinimonas caeni]
MLRETINLMRDLPRIREIIGTLARHGFGDLVRRMRLERTFERAGEMLHIPRDENSSPLEPAERARRVLEELGPTFIKLGQVLATRVDVFPPEWISEFEKLQSEVPPLPFEQLIPELEAVWGRAPDTIFRELDPHPIGSASIAQVHRARLVDGTPVILKIRRPNIVGKIDADLRILRHLAGVIEFEFPESRRYQPVRIVEQFSRSLKRELNLAAEAHNHSRFAKNFANSPFIVIPEVYWDWTNEIVNVQSYVAGVPGNDLVAVGKAGLDRHLLAKRGADAVLKMILIDGYFHADPHPGNVIYLPENRIAFIDFGMVGRLPHPRRDEIVDLLAALAGRDEQGILAVLIEWTGDAMVDEGKLGSDIAELIFNYENLPLKDIRFGNLLNDVIAIMREHSITLPADLTLLFKALITLEGLGRQLDPNFQMVPHLTPFVRQVIIHRYMPATLARKGQRSLIEIANIAGGLPRDVARLLKAARRGKLPIDLDLKRLDHFGQQLDKSTNRLTLGIVTGCLIIGSSIVMTVPAGPRLFGLPAFGLSGFLIAFFNSIWLIYSIWRSGKD